MLKVLFRADGQSSPQQREMNTMAETETNTSTKTRKPRGQGPATATAEKIITLFTMNKLNDIFDDTKFLPPGYAALDRAINLIKNLNPNAKIGKLETALADLEKALTKEGRTPGQRGKKPVEAGEDRKISVQGPEGSKPKAPFAVVSVLPLFPNWANKWNSGQKVNVSYSKDGKSVTITRD